MIRTLAEEKDCHLKWIDIHAPTPEEMHTIAKEYHIHEALIADVLQPEHLPKHESTGEISFFILRYYVAGNKDEADTIQALTDKIAIFHMGNLVITIHKYDAPFIEEIKREIIDTGACRGTSHILNRLVKSVLQSFEAPAMELAKQIDFYESKTFLKKNPPQILKGLYHVKRKVEVSRRLMLLTKDVLEKVDEPGNRDPEIQDTRDLHLRVLTLFDSMVENTNHLLTVYFSISAQRTNEVIRVLTVFSVFFMPLTFIVGIYGMNFHHMPEIPWQYGYPAVMLFMGAITLLIYLWFRRKGWL
jgi:magnesium transporter